MPVVPVDRDKIVTCADWKSWRNLTRIHQARAKIRLEDRPGRAIFAKRSIALLLIAGRLSLFQGECNRLLDGHSPTFGPGEEECLLAESSAYSLYSGNKGHVV